MTPDDQSNGNPQIRIVGPHVTKETAEEVGERLVDLLDAVADSMGLPTGLWTTGGVEISCDGCTARRPFDDEGHGWVRTAAGLDYCPGCIVTKPRRGASSS